MSSYSCQYIPTFAYPIQCPGDQLTRPANEYVRSFIFTIFAIELSMVEIFIPGCVPVINQNCRIDNHMRPIFNFILDGFFAVTTCPLHCATIIYCLLHETETLAKQQVNIDAERNVLRVKVISAWAENFCFVTQYIRKKIQC